MTGHLPQTARCDVRDNRARVLDAARAVFGEEGMSAPMREVLGTRTSAPPRCSGTSRLQDRYERVRYPQPDHTPL